MRYDRMVLAYHGCDAAVAERLLAGEPFRRSENDYDWLGAGVYFWEYGADRALQFARDQQRRGQVAEPAVVGALVQLETASTCWIRRTQRISRRRSGSIAASRRALDGCFPGM